MPTFMNELTQVTGGDFRFEDDASGFVIRNNKVRFDKLITPRSGSWRKEGRTCWQERKQTREGKKISIADSLVNNSLFL